MSLRKELQSLQANICLMSAGGATPLAEFVGEFVGLPRSAIRSIAGADAFVHSSGGRVVNDDPRPAISSISRGRVVNYDPRPAGIEMQQM